MLDFYVTKENGEKEIFHYRKLESSLRRVGASDEAIAEIVAEVGKEGRDGMTTHDIYRRAFAILRKRHKNVAIRYSLKKAVAMLGPTGFPFERFVAEIFRAQGYTTDTDQIVKGKCVEHEVDVVAWKPKELIMVEAKFHADFNLKSDLKIVLYVKARYDDIFGNKYIFGNEERKLTEGWIVTNTKFSSMAIQYSQCQPGLRVVGWNYPYDYNLHNMIEKYELIPLTALTTLSTTEKNMFLAKGIILSKDLLDIKILNEFKFGDSKIKTIQEEVDSLCEHCRKAFEGK